MLNLNVYAGLFFESIAVFTTLFFFIQYSILKKKEHLFYTLYLLAITVYYLIAVPELFFSVNDRNEASIHVLGYFKRPVQFLSSVFYTYFIIHYLGLISKSSYLFNFFKWLIRLYMLLAVVCLVLNFLNIFYTGIYYIVSILLFPVQLVTVIALLKHKVSYSKYIIAGTLILLIGSSITLMISLHGVNEPGSLLKSIHIFLPVQVSILINMFLFSIALQKKIADNERSLLNAASQRQEAIIVERERIIADLHDDVGGGLSSIRMMSELMANQGNPGNAASVAEKISHTAKDIAQRMNTIIWSLNEENDTLANMIEYVRQYGISFFENSAVQFQCTTDGDVPGDIQLKGVQRKNIFLIIKEAFHNILKHAGATNASVHIALADNILDIQVRDNGKGIINPNQFGNGLKNMKKRMDEIGGNLSITSDGGTIITIDVILYEAKQS